nr:MAG TPA: hypothetical protein [Caudoviricetes sp.]
MFVCFIGKVYCNFNVKPNMSISSGGCFSSHVSVRRR